MKKILVKDYKKFEELLNHLIKELEIEVFIDFEVVTKVEQVEGYHIKKVKNQVEITFQQTNHFFAAMMYVLSHQHEVNYEIQMNNHFKSLGLMLDTARNAVPKMETIKRYIMILSLLGYNYLELYVEDVMEVIDEPFYGYMRGKYSIEDIKELDKFANDYGIELIPCIQTLAHLNGIFKHTEYRSINDIDDILLVGNDKTYQLIENILKTTKEAFTSNKINIGMDEAWKLGLGKYLAQNGYQNRLAIMKSHLDKVLDLCHQYEYKPSMWADMFFHLTTGSYNQQKVIFSKDVIDQVPKDVNLIYWDYYRTEKKPYQDKFDSLKQLTNNYAFAGGAWKWIGYTPHNLFTIRSMTPAIEVAIENNVEDFMLTAWGDNGAEAAQLSILPSLIFISNQCYRSDDKDNYAKTLTKYSFDELLQLDLPDLLYKHEAYTPTNPSKYLLFEDLLTGHRQISVQKNYKGFYKKHTKILKELSFKESPYQYLFHTLYLLSDVLAIKSTLSLEIYEAYRGKNIDELKRIVLRIKKVIKKTKEFYEAFKGQWNIENKRFGFEIQTYRIGGLIQRLEEIISIINEYVSGNIESIIELDERVITPNLNKKYNGTIYFNQFINYISYNTF
ncbi:MAG: beta-N-acetylhexosaminidase [Tenericutes bacterium]|nr:beta-N-acetylhexosaminidase [Mycoplasmatota bacterium]